MSGFQDRFKRREKKYRIDEQQYQVVRDYLAHTMRPDDHGSCEVLSLYYDTRLFQLIEHSISKPTYKEKLRIRSYGVPGQDGCIFIEIKKKYRGIVYKRRVPASPRAAFAFMAGLPFDEAMQRYPIRPDARPHQTNPRVNAQIVSELTYMRDHYEGLAPAMLIACFREPFVAQDGSDLRITFDSDIRWRTDRLSLTAGSDGHALLPDGDRIMEVKTAAAIPLDFAQVLDDAGILPGSFSKYGTAYVDAVNDGMLDLPTASIPQPAAFPQCG
ncbi:MAG: polyphosphate polymerase domain-containing protein [Actinomycetota bacterium]|nr:polyphosphate polymerase domain-containing protein [Actinomycetota bacterium]